MIISQLIFIQLAHFELLYKFGIIILLLALCIMGLVTICSLSFVNIILLLILYISVQCSHVGLNCFLCFSFSF